MADRAERLDPLGWDQSASATFRVSNANNGPSRRASFNAYKDGVLVKHERGEQMRANWHLMKMEAAYRDPDGFDSGPEIEAGGFAHFCETATKTNSLVDRLEALTLPDPDDVADGLERYVEAKERAEELDAKIERTDELIDEIIYELYGLTDEEIEIVESTQAE